MTASLEKFRSEFIDREVFEREVLRAYADGSAEACLPADRAAALSWMPPATGALRDFSTSRRTCRCSRRKSASAAWSASPNAPTPRSWPRSCRPRTTRRWPTSSRRPSTAISSRISSPGPRSTSTCRRARARRAGCSISSPTPPSAKAAASAWPPAAITGARMIPKTDANLAQYRAPPRLFRELPDTPARLHPGQGVVGHDAAGIHAAVLRRRGLVHGLRRGHGDAHDADRDGLRVRRGNRWASSPPPAATTVFGSTYPYNPYRVPWTNSLFENAPADAMGIRAEWNRMRHGRTNACGCSAATAPCSTSGSNRCQRMLVSGMDIKVLVLDTQVYSNTGGQASTSTFIGQDSKMSGYGKDAARQIRAPQGTGADRMMHPDVFVAQTTAAHIESFLQRDHRGERIPRSGGGGGLHDRACRSTGSATTPPSARQSSPWTRARFRCSCTIRARAKPSRSASACRAIRRARTTGTSHPKGETVDFTGFARTEGRFAKHFDKDGNPSPELLKAQGRPPQELAAVAGTGGAALRQNPA